MTTLPNGPPLDEIQFRGMVPPGGIHDNSILWYFRDSPFYDKESSNETIALQSMHNAEIARDAGTRALFEARLKTMAGTEFIVGQEPSETAPGTGTGVWVINKQTRKKRKDREDEVHVMGTYFVVGENIYMAPSLADILSSRIVRSNYQGLTFSNPHGIANSGNPQATISSSITKAITAATEVQTWSPARGRVYANPTPSAARQKGTGLESKEATPMPAAESSGPPKPTINRAALDARLAEESLALHLRYGGEFMDLNPITGQPGSFHLSSTGRKGDRDGSTTNKNLLPVPVGAAAKGGEGESKDGQPLSLKDAGVLPALDTTSAAADNPLASKKDTKSPRAGGPPKPKRRKSKGGTATPTASAPATPTPRG